MLKKAVLFIFVTLATFSVQAQEENWTLDGRPNCFYESETDGRIHLNASLRKEQAPMKAVGTPVIPVILVDFADVKCSLKETDEELKEAFDKFFNGTKDGKPYTAHGSTSSVRDYFIDQSSGIFKPLFDIVGHVALLKERKVYSQNRTTLRNEALSAISELIKDNILRYDSNNDGVVDMAYVVFAGGGANVSVNPSDCVWPCEFSSRVSAGGVSYACSALCAELFIDRSSASYKEPAQMVGTGVYIHEFCHALGLPDMYDINYQAPGMDIWSIMDYGENIYNGRRPTNLNAYERAYLGWSRVDTLSEPTTLHLKTLVDGGNVYMLQNNNAAGEYYLLEYRNASGFDEYTFGSWLAIPEGGLIVYHIDEDAAKWSSNTVNTDINHQRITIIPANDVFTNLDKLSTADWKSERRGQLFPGTGEVTYLTDDSTPAAVVFNGGYLHQPLYDIALVDNEQKEVTLKYMPLGTMSAAVGLTGEFSSDKVSLSWSATENAECYNVECVVNGETISNDSISTNWTVLYLDGTSIDRIEYRVRALSDKYRDGEWSDWTTVENTTDIIDVHSVADSKVEIFTLDGIRKETGVRGKESIKTYRPGIYILRYSDGSTEKICQVR